MTGGAVTTSARGTTTPASTDGDAVASSRTYGEARDFRKATATATATMPTSAATAATDDQEINAGDTLWNRPRAACGS